MESRSSFHRRSTQGSHTRESTKLSTGHQSSRKEGRSKCVARSTVAGELAFGMFASLRLPMRASIPPSNGGWVFTGRPTGSPIPSASFSQVMLQHLSGFSQRQLVGSFSLERLPRFLAVGSEVRGARRRFTVSRGSSEGHVNDEDRDGDGALSGRARRYVRSINQWPRVWATWAGLGGDSGDC